jgi:hypothetical protein
LKVSRVTPEATGLNNTLDSCIYDCCISRETQTVRTSLSAADR